MNARPESKKVALRYALMINDYQDLMVAAGIGRNGSVRQIAGYKTHPNDTRPRLFFMGNLRNCVGYNS